jgi:hypothetical protein
MRFVPSASIWLIKFERLELLSPRTPTIAAMPIAMPMADMIDRLRRVFTPTTAVCRMLRAESRLGVRRSGIRMARRRAASAP